MPPRLPPVEVFLTEIEDGEWRFRPDQRIRRSIDDLCLHTTDGIPYIAPEIQLLHKARHHRPKDERDLRHVHDRLTPAQRAWLRGMLEHLLPADPWISRL